MAAEADARITAQAQRNADIAARLNTAPRGIAASELSSLFASAFPLHPVSFLILPHLFRRFGQSERSLFSFLGGSEAFGLGEFLDTHTLAPDALPSLRPDALYDYALAHLSQSLFTVGGAGKLWAQVTTAVARCENRTPLFGRVVKTVGLLHILGEQTRFSPTREVLHWCLCDTNAADPVTGEDVDAVLESLMRQTLLTYREVRRAYRPYEGSDVDVAERLKEARQEMSGRGVDVAATASKLAAIAPVVARRHSFETGTLRLFEVRI